MSLPVTIRGSPFYKKDGFIFARLLILGKLCTTARQLQNALRHLSQSLLLPLMMDAPEYTSQLLFRPQRRWAIEQVKCLKVFIVEVFVRLQRTALTHRTLLER